MVRGYQVSKNWNLTGRHFWPEFVAKTARADKSESKMITRNGRLAGSTIWSTLKGNVGTGSLGAATFDTGRGGSQALTYLRKDTALDVSI